MPLNFLSSTLSHPPAAALLDRDRWVAVGDSITQNGGYGACVHLYCATRFPELVLEPANAGVAGDSAAGALARYEWDIAPQRATVATVMFGMNDVDRGLYGDIAVTSSLQERRRAALRNYDENLSALAARLHADGVRVVLVTPSLFDETATGVVPRLSGVNSALAECAAIMRRIAAERGHALIDVHGPMSSINARLQSADPSFSVVGPDRVHPGPPGHLLIAHLMLKGLGMPSMVSAVEIDAVAGRARAENAEVSAAVFSGAGIEFVVRAAALPYPIFDDARPALGWVPFHDDLNREMLRVTGLAPGRHALFIDGTEVRRYTDEEFAAGVNLALEPDTPQMRQARGVGELVRRRQQVLAKGPRVIAQIEHGRLRELSRPVDLDAARPLLERMLADLAMKTAPIDLYHRGVIEDYLRAKPVERETRFELVELLKLIRAAARPRSRAYRLVPVGSCAG